MQLSDIYHLQAFWTIDQSERITFFLSPASFPSWQFFLLLHFDFNTCHASTFQATNEPIMQANKTSGAEVKELTGEISFNLDKLRKLDYVHGFIGDRPP